MTAEQNTPQTQKPGLLIRLLAIIYDCLLLIALLMIATLPYIMIIGGPPQSLTARLGLQLYLLVIIVGFFGWFWTHGGQTLGMRSWRLKLVTNNGDKLGWTVVFKRLFGALLSATAVGLGYIWIVFDPQQRSWHDILSGTHLIRLPKKKKS
ncbi:MAG: RDD family protein [Proteobacteria bacterium]|nr:RDD family protein [Pseudomonadota bacterium]